MAGQCEAAGSRVQPVGIGGIALWRKEAGDAGSRHSMVGDHRAPQLTQAGAEEVSVGSNP